MTVMSAEGELLFHSHVVKGAIEERIANARVAAAAPDMLHALELVLSSPGYGDLMEFERSRVMEAVKKARGKL